MMKVCCGKSFRFLACFGAALFLHTICGVSIADAISHSDFTNTRPRNTSSQHQSKEMSQTHTDKTIMNKEDASIMRHMAKANIAKIQLAGLAQAISRNEVVRGYAQRMLDDHANALKELKKLAMAQHVVLPGGPDEQDVIATRQLALLKGKEFDQQFFAYAIGAAHEKSLQLHRNASEKAENGSLKEHATTGIKMINKHFEWAQDAQRAYSPA